MSKTSYDLGADIYREIERQTKEVTEEIQKIYEDEVPQVIKDLEEYSPKRTGEYSRSWYSEKEGQIWHIRNKKPMLTNVLEKGRMIKGKIKGRRPHIEKCRKRSEARLLKKLGGK